MTTRRCYAVMTRREEQKKNACGTEVREHKKRAAEAARNPAQAAETRAEYGGNAAVRPRGTYPLERRAVRRPEENTTTAPEAAEEICRAPRTGQAPRRALRRMRQKPSAGKYGGVGGLRSEPI